MAEIEIGSSGKVMRFMTKDRIRLTGILFHKSPAAKTCIIFLHGMGSSMVNNVSLAFPAVLSKDFAFFSFNNRGHDAVFNTSRILGKKRKRFTAGTNFEKFEDSVYDIKGAIDALSKLGYKRFVLCGHSTGCQKAIYYDYKTHDKRVLAIILLSPADDYNMHKKELGKGYSELMNRCKKLIRSGKPDVVPDEMIGFSAQRLDSVLNLNRIEARIFNYNGELVEFGSVKTPILAVFGSDEEYALMPVRRYLNILDIKSRSERFRKLEIVDANHSFEGREIELVKKVNSWLSEL